MSEANSPAYPWGNSMNMSGGLTKRELFAAMAMQGLIAAKNYVSARTCAEDARLFADALLAAIDAEATP